LWRFVYRLTRGRATSLPQELLSIKNQPWQLK
jgi:hypothetical protein